MEPTDLIERIQLALKANNNKLSPDFIGSLVLEGEVKHFQLTPTMRVCVITLPSGHEVLGKAQVLDPANDVESIGQAVAYDNAVNELWMSIGSIAKAVL